MFEREIPEPFNISASEKPILKSSENPSKKSETDSATTLNRLLIFIAAMELL